MPITHSIYLINDIETAIRFLKNTFRFEVTADEITVTGERFLTMGDVDKGGLQLQLVKIDQQSEIASLKRQAVAVDFIFETDDIEEMITRVKDQKLNIHRQPTNASYGWTAIFEDPSGNLWDLIQRH